MLLIFKDAVDMHRDEMECCSKAKVAVTWRDACASMSRQCLQKVEDCAGITIDVWPLHDAHSLTDDGPMPPKFKSTPFFQKLCVLATSQCSCINILFKKGSCIWAAQICWALAL